MNKDPGTEQHPGEGDQAGQALLASKKTLKDILEVATSFEKTACEFYTALTERGSHRGAIVTANTVVPK